MKMSLPSSSKRKHNVNENITTLTEIAVPEISEKFTVSPETCIEKFDGGVLFLEPFFGGSHKQLVDTLVQVLPNSRIVSLPAKKWPWRARCGALCLSTLIPDVANAGTLFCSSVLSLAEMLGLRPDLQAFNKVVYFHENQLVYPIREIKDRDVQFAYNQITTCLAADVVLFNSRYNMNSFLQNIAKVLKLIPAKLDSNAIRTKIEQKTSVVYFPLSFHKDVVVSTKSKTLHIVWPHRWEFDKGPEEFFNIMFQLKDENLTFKVSILGEMFEDVPDIFEQAKNKLRDEICQWGYCESKEQYFSILRDAHVVVSTAKHEFFGVSVLESTFYGCYPLVPNRLVYPEIYPKECIYNTDNQLFKMLKQFCNNIDSVERLRRNLNIDFAQFSTNELLPKYVELLTKSCTNK